MREVDGCLIPYEGNDVGPTLRQDKPCLWARNGPAILIVRADIIDAQRLYGDPTLGYEMDRWTSLDVDGPEDLRVADILIRSSRQ